MDDKGNVYVADTSNLAIRKISESGTTLGQSLLNLELKKCKIKNYYCQKACFYLSLFSGVTTIAGGKSNIAGYRDGPSEDAKFSSDFDVVYVGRTCSLIVVDRGNAALRQISLQQEDCEYQDTSVSTPGYSKLSSDVPSYIVLFVIKKHKTVIHLQPCDMAPLFQYFLLHLLELLLNTCKIEASFQVELYSIDKIC